LYKSRRENDTVSINDSDVQLPTKLGDNLPAELLVGLRPENIKPNPNGKFSGQLVLTEPLGVETILHIKSKERTFLSLVPGITSFHIGDVINFNIADEHIHYFGLNGDRLQS
jgi:multiple sugar transport system ATP-binding protein